METSSNHFQELLTQISEEFPQQLAERTAQRLRSMSLTLAVAESMTGGLLSASLTACPGSSDFLIGGVVCYSPRVKVQLVGIPPRLIAEQGEVSEAVTLAMAQGIRLKLSTDFGIGITGFAGPAVSDTEKIGLVFISISHENHTRTQQFVFEGDRSQIREHAVHTALGLLYFELRGEKIIENVSAQERKQPINERNKLDLKKTEEDEHKIEDRYFRQTIIEAMKGDEVNGR